MFGNDYLEDHGVWLTFGEFTPDSLLFMEIVLPHLLDAMEHADYHGRDWQTLPCALPFTRLGQWRCNVRRQVLCWAVIKETQRGERLLFPLEAPWYGSFKPLAEANAIVALPMNKAVIPLGEPLPHMLLSNAALPQVSEEDLARIEAAKAALAAEQARRAELAALPPLPMAQAWAQLEAWLKQEEPALLRSLGKPASPEALAELEAKLKLSLPDDFKAALSVHDGQKGEEPLFEGEFFLSTKGVLSQWRTWTKLMKSPDMAECSGAPDEGIRPDWFHPAWIPFTHDGMGNHLCLDLDPAEGGQVGQIIRVWHDDDERQLIAPSFAVWFSRFVRSLPNEDEAAPGVAEHAG
ncbi:SMI1/KNR4 family protein [Chitinimonas taiwanensis]|uniref:SMI1/KNR4 family protein n=1 Tax=Chitinimonas taiwanensis TaxID=240412 RepID=UPI0035AE280D